MKLCEPLSLGTMALRNHIVMPAMGTSLAELDGSVSERAIAYYSRRAAGGVGLVTLEVTAVHRLSRLHPRHFMIDRDDRIEGIRRLARSVQAHGARFAVQLWHVGHAGDPDLLGEPPVGPSPVPAPGRTNLPRELSEGEIQELIECHAEAARRAREAGCDAVEVHGAHGYLIAQFLSPLSNRRTDRYGGELRNRARFGLEVVARIRERVGRDFPVLCKLSAEEHVEGGITPAETETVARWLQEAGVDALLISSGSRVAPIWTVQPMSFPRGCLVHYAAAVKAVVDVPVGAVGRINDPLLAERVLQEGRADFVALGRALIADPDFPRKAEEGRFGEIRTCTACRHCARSVSLKQPIQCMVNPEVGRELEWTVERAPEPKRVLVVGAGPAGLEAACTAAGRGHRVALHERAGFLGGMVALGCRPPFKAELKTVVDYYAGELERRRVEVHLGREVTAETVREVAPDIVVVAAGSVPVTPAVPGIEQPNVVQARDALAEEAAVGGSAVVIGGGSVGCETAECLRARGAEVTVLEMLGDFARDVEPGARQLLLERLQSAGVRLVANARVLRIEGRRVVYADAGGREARAEGDAIVLAVGARPNTALPEALRSLGVPVVAVGDCLEPRKIHDAIYEGAMAGRRI